MAQRNSSSLAGQARKEIHGEQDLRNFLESDTFKDLWTFVLRCNDAVKNSPISSCKDMKGSMAVDSLVIVLDNLSKLVDEIPPAKQAERYGNSSFTVWHKELVSRSESMIGKSQQAGSIEFALDSGTIRPCPCLRFVYKSLCFHRTSRRFRVSLLCT
mmetsp:Transcript_14228/g.20694  ORF Transcript_14228/g.20694 Transcript_14228/m.20694 type:complete len:157 (+) Transcript_14228:71-541(+)